MNLILDWLSMGGYYAYVWSAYSLVTGVLLINVFMIKRQKTTVRQSLQKWFKDYS